MSRFIGVALLLIILAANFFDSTASPLKYPALIGQSASSKCMCKCREFPNGKIMCRSPPLHKNNVEKQHFLKCNCKKPKKPSKSISIPISLM